MERRQGFTDWIFPNTTGGPLGGGQLAAHGRLERSEEGHWRLDLRVHDLCHTAASIWVGSGADPKVVQRILGHASAMTMDLYGYLIDSTATCWMQRRRSGTTRGPRRTKGWRETVIRELENPELLGGPDGDFVRIPLPPSADRSEGISSAWPRNRSTHDEHQSPTPGSPAYSAKIGRVRAGQKSRGMTTLTPRVNFPLSLGAELCRRIDI